MSVIPLTWSTAPWVLAAHLCSRHPKELSLSAVLSNTWHFPSSLFTFQPGFSTESGRGWDLSPPHQSPDTTQGRPAQNTLQKGHQPFLWPAFCVSFCFFRVTTLSWGVLRRRHSSMLPLGHIKQVILFTLIQWRNSRVMTDCGFLMLSSRVLIIKINLLAQFFPSLWFSMQPNWKEWLKRWLQPGRKSQIQQLVYLNLESWTKIVFLSTAASDMLRYFCFRCSFLIISNMRQY